MLHHAFINKMIYPCKNTDENAEASAKVQIEFLENLFGRNISKRKFPII